VTTIAPVDHWLDEAERTDFPLRPFVGATATVFVLQLGPACWRVAWSTTAPGHFERAVQQPHAMAWPNRYNAMLSGLQGVRAHWKQVGLPQLVAAVNTVIDSLDESE
jgi:hypothetical protein